MVTDKQTDTDRRRQKQYLLPEGGQAIIKVLDPYSIESVRQVCLSLKETLCLAELLSCRLKLRVSDYSMVRCASHADLTARLCVKLVVLEMSAIHVTLSSTVHTLTALAKEDIKGYKRECFCFNIIHVHESTYIVYMTAGLNIFCPV